MLIMGTQNSKLTKKQRTKIPDNLTTKDKLAIKNLNIFNVLKQMRLEMHQALMLYNTKFLSENFCNNIAIVFSKKLQELKIDDTRLLTQYINSDISNTKFNMYYKFDPNKETEYIINNLDVPLKDYFFDH